MIKGTPELVAQRREEIVNACEALYQTMSFKDITLKEIGQVTSFSRPTIYNYFQTKEEIFLALYQREYDRWNEVLENILRENDSMTHAQLADAIARSLEERGQLLKLLAMNNYDKDKIDYHVFKPVLFEFPTYEYFATGDKVGDCAKMNR